MSSSIVHDRVINVSEFVEARAAQIADLLAVVDNASLVSGEVTKGPRTAAQRLPRHMRRRAMSHDVMRMPKGFRAFAKPFLDKSKHRKKPPSRFARRRPRNLLLNYIRRQRAHAWLETHIWHAKRFHLTERWGYRIPDRSFQRAFRPIYRYTRRHAVIRDKSYLTCFLMSSPSREALLSSLSPLCCPPTVAPSLKAASSMDGRTEMTTVLYEKDSYPRGLIGPARFLWSTTNSGRAQLALWVHPSTRDTVLDQLKGLLGLEKVARDEADQDEKKLTSPSSISEWRAARTRILTDVYEGQNDVQLEDLRDQLSRFRLTGPRSLKILSETLILAQGDAAEEYQQAHALWREVYGRCEPGEVRDGTTVTLLVEDPRCGRPPKRGLEGKMGPPPEQDPDEVEQPVPSTSIWSRDDRLEALEMRLPNAEMNKLKGEGLGGVRETDAKIPALVVIRNGGELMSAGVDVVVPAGFGADLWIALQLRTARASGLRDECAAHTESGTPCFPFDAVETVAGGKEEERARNEKETKHLSRPWNRRPAFWCALSILHPFDFVWPQLVKEWGAKGNPYVLRDRRELSTIEEWFTRGRREAEVKELLVRHESAFIPVRLECVFRGRPRRLALVCLPTKEDLANLKRARKSGKPVCIVQPPRREEEKKEKEDEMKVNDEDPEAKRAWQNEMWRDVVAVDAAAREKTIPLRSMFPVVDTSRAQKRKLLNRKKKERVKRRKLTADARAAIAEAEEKEKQAVGEVCGRVLRGDFSFIAAKGAASALLPLSALPAVRRLAATVLFRNTTSKYYHPARVTVDMSRLDL